MSLPACLCLECGAPIATDRDATFCATGCRQAFNNRRLKRGAELYDLWMAHRYERPLARALHVLTAVNRLAASWRQQDRLERAGRRSWTAPDAVLDRTPWLRAAVLQR
jgi:predicted nucleic acid-binding Zn ribbon protein